MRTMVLLYDLDFRKIKDSLHTRRREPVISIYESNQGYSMMIKSSQVHNGDNKNNLQEFGLNLINKE